jgi:hypothetical protein
MFISCRSRCLDPELYTKTLKKIFERYFEYFENHMHKQNEDEFVHQLLKQFHENLDFFNEDKNNRKRILYRKIEFSYLVTLTL